MRLHEQRNNSEKSGRKRVSQAEKGEWTGIREAEPGSDKACAPEQNEKGGDQDLGKGHG